MESSKAIDTPDNYDAMVEKFRAREEVKQQKVQKVLADEGGLQAVIHRIHEQQSHHASEREKVNKDQIERDPSHPETVREAQAVRAYMLEVDKKVGDVAKKAPRY